MVAQSPVLETEGMCEQVVRVCGVWCVRVCGGGWEQCVCGVYVVCVKYVGCSVCVAHPPPHNQGGPSTHPPLPGCPPSREHIDPTPALLSNSPLLQALWNSLEALTSPRPPPSDLCPATWRLGWC